MESARLLELAIAVHIHREPRPIPCLNLYFDGMQVTRSFAAFGSSYAPVENDEGNVSTKLLQSSQMVFTIDN